LAAKTRGEDIVGKSWNYGNLPKKRKKRKKYNKGGKAKEWTQEQINILSMADTELAAELYPYLENNPVAKLGLDSYLFEQGKIDPDNFNQKLLKIRTDPNIVKIYKALQEGRTDVRVSPAAAKYNRKTDQITMNMLGGWHKTNPEITGKIPQKEFIFTQGEYGPETVWAGAHGKKGQISNLIHELTHRGANYLQQNLPEYSRESIDKAIKENKPIPIYKQMLDDHPAMEVGDREVADKLGIQFQGVNYRNSKKRAEWRKKAIKRTWKAKPHLSKRYPSTKTWNY
jgi:hypothetical protein